MKNFRIAVCISGQSRTWEYCKDNILHFYDITEHAQDRVEVDYFLHTWDINSYKDHVSGNEYTNFRDEPFNDGNRLIEAFNPKIAEVERYSDFVAKRNLQYPNFPLTAWESMYHSIKKSINFKRLYELDKNFEYDLVIKTRFDCIYDPGIKFIAYIPEVMKAYSSYTISRILHEFNSNNFDEAIFFGESRTVDLISAAGDLHMLNRSTKEYQSSMEFDILPEAFYGPGALIYKHMTDMNICPSHHFVPFYYVVARQHTIDLGLNPMTDWPQVVKSCKDWYL
jgi:hypothetical protein